MACILAGVLLLTGMGGYQIASANSPEISQDENGTQDYVVAAYPNILKPISEWPIHRKHGITFVDLEFFSMFLNGR